MNGIICRSGNERQQTCREILGTQDRSNGCLDCFVRLGTLEDSYTDAHLIAPPPPSSPLRDHPPDPMSRTVGCVNGYHPTYKRKYGYLFSGSYGVEHHASRLEVGCIVGIYDIPAEAICEPRANRPGSEV